MYHNDGIAYGPRVRDSKRDVDEVARSASARPRAVRLRTRRTRARRMALAFVLAAVVVGIVALVTRSLTADTKHRSAPTNASSPPTANPVSLPAPAAPPCTTYVAPSGSDTGPGTLARPMATVTHAAAVATRRNAVCLRAGIYHEVVHVLRSNVTVQSFPGERAVIDGTGVALAPTDALVQIAGGANDVTLRDLTIQNSPGRGVVNDGSRNRVIGTTITHTMNAGLLTTNLNAAATDNQYLDNEISFTVQSNDCHTPSDPCLKTGGWESAVNGYESGTAPSGHNLYSGNHVHDNDGEGMSLMDGDVVRGNTVNDNFGAEIYLDRKQDVLIESNLLYESETHYLPITQNQSYRLLARGIGLADEFPPPRTSGNTIRNNLMLNLREGINFWNATHGSGLINTTIDNNTIVDSWDYGIEFDPSNTMSNTILRDNIIVPRQGGLTKGVVGVRGIQTIANLFSFRGGPGDPYLPGEGTFSIDPNDYRLESVSQTAIDKGVPSSATIDYFGTPRPQGGGFDIGADEAR